jgi:hypothetical protein
MTGRPEGQAIEHLGRIIRAEIRTKATPQQAYDAWADPERDSPTGFPTARKEKPNPARRSPGSSTSLTAEFPAKF